MQARFLSLINAEIIKLCLHSAEKRRERRRKRSVGEEFCQHLKPSLVMRPTAAIIFIKPLLQTQACSVKFDKYLVNV